MLDRRSCLMALLGLPLPGMAAPQGDPAEDFRVFGGHPRLLLTPRRLRLLRRERERESMRWQQFERLAAGGVRMPEPGFAYALLYQITGDEDAARKAVEWAAGPGADLRQLALVYDWRLAGLKGAARDAVSRKLVAGLNGTGQVKGCPEAAAVALAAAALSEDVPGAPERALEAVAGRWWKREIVGPVRKALNPVSRQEHYALFEFLHVVRDNLREDLRETIPGYFKEFPAYHLHGHYPAPLQAGSGEFRIPVLPGNREPDLNTAALSRAAGFAMVAYDTNALETQFLQGWLMHDRFLLHTPYGAPYELLWANPYQPGLSYDHLSRFFQEPGFGALFLRSEWTEDTRWVGLFGGELQVMEGGKLQVWKAGEKAPAIEVGGATVLSARDGLRTEVDTKAGGELFLVGLEPATRYLLEPDDQEVSELISDGYGMARMNVGAGPKTGVRLRRVR